MRNALQTMPVAQTMSSLEIATLTGKTPGNVNRDIKVMCEQLGYSDLNSNINQGVTVILNAQNQTAEIRLDKDHSLTLMTGYDAKMRMAVNKRWRELEEQNKPPSYIESLRLYANSLEKIEQDAPKVKFAEIVGNSSNTRCVRVWVKAMKDEHNLVVGEREVFKWLLEKGYIFKESGGYLPYAKYESTGTNYFTIVIDEINGKARRMLKITGKGVVSLTGKVVEYFTNKQLELSNNLT